MTLRPPTDGPDGSDEPGLDLERLVFFSDAVFAIAITLLVIELQLPGLAAQPTDDQVADALRASLPRIFAYALSFATIGLYWFAHWRRFHLIVRVNERLAVLNLVLLGFVAFIPFPTALIGEHGDRPAIVVLYAATLAAAGLAGLVTWIYAWRAGLVRRDVDESLARFVAFRALSVPVVMLGSILLLPIAGPAWVTRSWLLIVPVQYVFNRRLRPHSRDAHRP